MSVFRSDAKHDSRPGVYIFMQGQCYLYIGSTNDLDKRPSKRDRGHKSRFAAILACDRVEIIDCESLVKAQQLEEQLIRKHRPEYNLRKPCAAANLERTTQIIRDNW